ncbi:MAG: hypothetical protein JK586_13330 [Nocardiopsis sp. BM-2018]|nr:MAG: hypothetical protein JK586_13330 [Nocardiopsis sp. BM-2018]
MRHIVFVTLIAVFVVAVAQNWAIYAAALMLSAWFRHGGRLRARIN